VYSYETSTTRGDGGLTLGNSTSEDDMVINYADGSSLNIASGSLNYKNIANDSIEGWMGGSITVGSNASLNIFEDIYLNGIITFHSNSTYAHKSGKEIKAGITYFGSFNTIEF
jgi:hypothetical protein